LQTILDNSLDNIWKTFNQFVHFCIVVSIDSTFDSLKIVMGRTLIIDTFALVNTIDNYTKRVYIHWHIVGITIWNSLIHIG
jgi:hypothetical protein